MPSSPPPSSPLTLALADLLEAYRLEDAGGTTPVDVLERLERDPALKRALAPVAGPVRWHDRASGLMHRCLEQPPDSPLRQAADAVLERGLYTEPVHVALSPTPPPTRLVMRLLPSRVAPVLYGTEMMSRVTVWSSDDGAHLGDLPLPRRGSRPSRLAELPDGTLRVITSDGDICERSPGQDSFTRVLSLRPKGSKYLPSAAASADLRYSLVAREPAIVEGPDGDRIEFLLHDVDAPRKPRPFTLSGSHWLGTIKRLDPTTMGVVHARSGAEDASFVLSIVDLVAGRVLQELPIQGDVSDFSPSADGQAVLVGIREDDQSRSWWRVERADGQRTAIAPDAIDPGTAQPRELDPSAVTYDGRDRLLRGSDGSVLARYTPVGLLTAVSAYPGPRPGWFVLTSGGDDGTLTLIAPYDPARAAVRPAPPSAPTSHSVG